MSVSKRLELFVAYFHEYLKKIDNGNISDYGEIWAIKDLQGDLMREIKAKLQKKCPVDYANFNNNITNRMDVNKLEITQHIKMDFNKVIICLNWARK